MTNEVPRKRGRPRKGEERPKPEPVKPVKKKPNRGRNNGKRGAPEIGITDEVLRQAEELSGYGLSATQIAAVLGMGETTFHQKRNESRAFSEALERGKAKAAGIVGKALFLRAKDGDIGAIRWWEMTRQGRSERTQTEAKVEVINDGQTEARLARLVAQIASEIEARDNTEAAAELEP
jgi:hypothetical protein